MPNVHLKNGFLSYLDNEANSDLAVIFIHGNSHSSKTFRHQFSDSSLNNFRLIALDLPGHGESYSLPEFHIKDMVDALKGLINELKLENYILVGHSLGGHIAIEALETVNPQGIFIYGTPPLSLPLDLLGFIPNEDLGLIFKDDLTDSEMMKLIKNFYSTECIDQIGMEDLKRTSAHFRSSLNASLMAENFKNERVILNNFKGFKTIVHALKDKLVNVKAVETHLDLDGFWQNKVIEIDSSHNCHVEHAEEFNDLLNSFIHENQNQWLPFKIQMPENQATL